MSEGLKKAGHIATTALMAVVLLLCALLVGGRLFGFQAFAVMSGSMEPAYSTGDLIYVKSVEPEELQAGDVITYLVSGDTVVTHRIVEVVQDAEDPSVTGFRTQGDANATPDGGIVHEDNLIGTPVLSVPLAGYVAGYVQSPPGTYIALVVCALLVFLVFVPDLFAKDDEEAEKPAPSGKHARGGRSHNSGSSQGQAAQLAYAQASMSQAAGANRMAYAYAGSSARTAQAGMQAARQTRPAGPRPTVQQSGVDSERRANAQSHATPHQQPATYVRPAQPHAAPRPQQPAASSRSAQAGVALVQTRPAAGSNNPRLAKACAAQAPQAGPTPQQPQRSYAKEGGAA